MPDKPEILASHLVAQSRLFRVESLDLRFSNGVERTYERLIPGGHGAVMMVPKGAVDMGETAEQAANRELKEEIGMGARQLKFLKNMSLSPSYIKSGIDVWLAWDLYPEKLDGDEPEPLELVTWPLDKIHELVQREDMTEGRAIAALYMAKDCFPAN